VREYIYIHIYRLNNVLRPTRIVYDFKFKVREIPSGKDYAKASVQVCTPETETISGLSNRYSEYIL
jgi:hypothetical protein